MKVTVKHMLSTAAALGLAAGVMAANPASAQGWNHGHDRGNHAGRGYDRGYDRGYNHGYNRGSYHGWHERTDWRRGGYVSRGDWDRGVYVDYRYHHGLYRPPYGYEWRQVGDRYVLVALTTGLIAAMIEGGY